ncbi:MAG: DUF86 domain-containing protein [Victivallaceae bacterium]|nr:DUF86 domain-containing protein [Victivallaceae bacterium]
MQNKINKYLFDIKESINAIENYIKDEMEYEAYSNDRKTRRAVEREFEIIGEAMNRINKLNSDIQISNKRQIIDMRNKVIHGYDMVNDLVVWGTIKKYLPILKTEIQKKLESI